MTILLPWTGSCSRGENKTDRPRYIQRPGAACRLIRGAHFGSANWSELPGGYRGKGTSIPLLRRLKMRSRVLPQGFGKWAYIYLFLCRDSNRQPSGGKEAAEQIRRFTVGFLMVLVRFAVGFLTILLPKPIETPREFKDFFETGLAKILSRGGFSSEANAHFGCCTTLRRRGVA